MLLGKQRPFAARGRAGDKRTQRGPALVGRTPERHARMLRWGRLYRRHSVALRHDAREAPVGVAIAIEDQETLSRRPTRTAAARRREARPASLLAPHAGASRPATSSTLLRFAPLWQDEGIRRLAILSLVCLVILLAVSALDGMQQYARVRTEVLDGMAHLRAAQALLDARQRTGHALDAATLTHMDDELAEADDDFAALRAEFSAPTGAVLLGAHVPRLAGRIASAAALAAAADEALRGARDLVAGARVVLELQADGFLDASGRLTKAAQGSAQAATLSRQLTAGLAAALPHLDAAVAGTEAADLSVFPPSVASPAQALALHARLATWPTLRARLAAPNGSAFFATAMVSGQPLRTLLAA